MGFYTYSPIVETFEIQVPKKIDPFKRLRGWSELGEKVMLIKTAHPDATLLADSRKLVTELLYYTRPEKVVKWNITDRIGDHYDLTTKVKQGRNYLLVTKNPNLIRKIEGLGNEYSAEYVIKIPI